MSDPFVYDIPSAAGGDQGLDGYDVVDDRRVGRVVSLNETRDGLVLLIEPGERISVAFALGAWASGPR